jgi:hypothetical protein
MYNNDIILPVSTLPTSVQFISAADNSSNSDNNIKYNFNSNNNIPNIDANLRLL